jgi:hypothetical protein
MIVGGLIGLAAIIFGLHVAHKDYSRTGKSKVTSGWIYFAAAEEGPVRIGHCAKEPTLQRCPELQHSPVPLRIFFKFRTPDVRRDLGTILATLKDDKDHGSWYERDSTLAYISHLRGED